MSEVAATTAEPFYINRLALNHLPFARVTSTAAFYDGSHIKQRRLLLQHLLRATRTPVLLQGASGTGKTTLLEQMQRQAATDIRYCIITAAIDSLTADKSITEVLEADIQEPQDEHACETAIRQRLLQLRRVNIVPVLVVDDVEQLSDSLRQQLKDWLQWQDEDGELLWQAIVSCQSDLNLDFIDFQKLDMPVLEAVEVAPYLLQRLQAAGYNGDLPFSSKDLHRFYRLSAGNPGKLNQLAHQHLLGMKVATTGLSRLHSLLRQAGRWSVVLVLGLIIIVALIYQKQINNWIDKPEEQQETLSLPPLADNNEVATVVIGEDNPPAAQPRQELADLLAEIPPSYDTELESQSRLQEPAQQSHNPDDSEPDKVTGSRPEALQTDAEITVQTTRVTKTDPQQTQGDVGGRDWIMAQNPTDYTFQLMGAWDAAEVDTFIDKYALTGQVARFTSLRDNKPWHVLIYGVYPGKQAAMKASNNWPAPLNTLPIWLRRFDSVQKQIREKGVTSP